MMRAAALAVWLLGCSGKSSAAQGPVVSVVPASAGAVALSGRAQRSVRISANGSLEILNPDGAVRGSTSGLANGCEAGNAFAVTSDDGRFLLLMPYDCEVVGATKVFVGSGEDVRELDEVPFNLVKPIVAADSAIVVASAFAGRFDLRTMGWAWRRRVDAPARVGGGGIEPESVSLRGRCVVISEVPFSAAQFRRGPVQVALEVEGGEERVGGCEGPAGR
jgi:hypothetical protein